MGLVDSFLGMTGMPFNAGTPAPADDFWYQPVGNISAAGMRVTSVQAMRLSVVYACVRLISFTMASLPLKLFERVPMTKDDGTVVMTKRIPTNHPITDLLREPNDWQTAFQFRQMLWTHVELRGNFYAAIIRGVKSSTEQLIPIDPDTVTVLQDSKTHRVEYLIQPKDGSPTVTLQQEDVLHHMGLSLDGLTGLTTISAWAEVVGLGLGLQDYAARFVANDQKPGGIITTPHTMKPEAKETFREDWKKTFSGTHRHGTAVLQAGMKYEALTITNKDAQFLEARKMNRSEVASLFGVQPHKIGDLEKASFSNIEEQNIDFVVDAVRPRAVALEQSMNRDLIFAKRRFFVEHNLDGLLRGNIATRFAAYSIGVDRGFLLRNEVRTMENLNPLPGLDEPLVPMNMAPVSGNGTRPDSRATMLALAAAQLTTRKELAAVRKAADRMNGNKAGQQTEFITFLDDYYGEMPSRLCSRLGMKPEQAHQYASNRRRMLMEAKQRGFVSDVLIEWEKEDGSDLARIALERGQ